MKVTNIKLFKTGLQPNYENVFRHYGLGDLKFEHYNFLLRTFDYIDLNEDLKGVNFSKNFTLQVRGNFLQFSKYDYCSFEVFENDVYKYYFYFIIDIKETNSIGSCSLILKYDDWVNNLNEIYNSNYDSKFFTEKRTIDYIKRDSDAPALLFDETQILPINNLNSNRIIEPISGVGVDILWYRYCVDSASYAGAIDINGTMARKTISPDSQYTNYGSMIYLFRPYKIFRKGTFEDVTSQYLVYGREEVTLNRFVWTDIVLRPIEIYESSYIIKQDFTFYAPLDWSFDGNSIYIDGYVSKIFEGNTNDYILKGDELLFFKEGNITRDYYRIFAGVENIRKEVGFYESNNNFNRTWNDSKALKMCVSRVASPNYNIKLVSRSFEITLPQLNLLSYYTIDLIPREGDVRVEISGWEERVNGVPKRIFYENIPLMYSNSQGEFLVTQSQKDVFLRNNGNSFAIGMVAKQIKNISKSSNMIEGVAGGVTAFLSDIAKLKDLDNARNNMLIPSLFSGSDEIYQDRVFVMREYIDIPSVGGELYPDDNIKTMVHEINKTGYMIYRETDIKKNYGHFFDYIKTNDCNIPSIDQISRNEVSSIFNKGVRIWDAVLFEQHTELLKNFNTNVINFGIIREE